MKSSSRKNLFPVRGLAILNPVPIEKNYALRYLDYMHENGLNHLQIHGDIHTLRRANIDGVIRYKKYPKYDKYKDSRYLGYVIPALQEITRYGRKLNINTYLWHHELEIPRKFLHDHKELLNKHGEVRLEHPLVSDFIINKHTDFFNTYPDISGTVITFLETSIPVLSLKYQELKPVERVIHILKILIKMHKKYNKELIIRPFASSHSATDQLVEAIKPFRKDITVMTKWCRGDWHFGLPVNPSIKKLSQLPLIIEGEVHGEYFGKGELPLVYPHYLKKMISDVSRYKIQGFVIRVDREGYVVRENKPEALNRFVGVNLIKNPHASLISLEREYAENKLNIPVGDFARLIRDSERVLRETLYIDNNHWNHGGRFFTLYYLINRYIPNVFTGEKIRSDEWFIFDKKNSPVKTVKNRMKENIELSENCMDFVKKNIPSYAEEYEMMHNAAKAWYYMFNLLDEYTANIRKKKTYDLNKWCRKLLDISRKFDKKYGKNHYFRRFGDSMGNRPARGKSVIERFVDDIMQYYKLEKKMRRKLNRDNRIIDYILCGSFLEGHLLSKETSYSFPLIYRNRFIRVAGSKPPLLARATEDQSELNQGWFSYILDTRKAKNFILEIEFASVSKFINIKVKINNNEETIYLRPKSYFISKQWEFKNYTKKIIDISFSKLTKEIAAVSGITLIES
ncbi:hypothetical protein KKC91_06805 [bacterium]|nr:hypothetical protein [bacterium]